MADPHDNPQYETKAAKAMERIVALVEEEIGSDKVGCMAFVFDYRGGFLGYCSSIERLDGVQLVGEWLDQQLASLTQEQTNELVRRMETGYRVLTEETT